MRNINSQCVKYEPKKDYKGNMRRHALTQAQHDYGKQKFISVVIVWKALMMAQESLMRFVWGQKLLYAPGKAG